MKKKMKAIYGILFAIMIIGLTGCGEVTKEDLLKQFANTKYIEAEYEMSAAGAVSVDKTSYEASAAVTGIIKADEQTIYTSADVLANILDISFSNSTEGYMHKDKESEKVTFYYKTENEDWNIVTEASDEEGRADDEIAFSKLKELIQDKEPEFAEDDEKYYLIYSWTLEEFSNKVDEIDQATDTYTDVQFYLEETTDMIDSASEQFDASLGDKKVKIITEFKRRGLQPIQTYLDISEITDELVRGINELSTESTEDIQIEFVDITMKLIYRECKSKGNVPLPVEAESADNEEGHSTITTIQMN